MPTYYVNVQGSVDPAQASSAEAEMLTRGTWDDPPFFTKRPQGPGTFFMATTQVPATNEDEAVAAVRGALDGLPGLIELEVNAL
jgi:hypothetical protein